MRLPRRLLLLLILALCLSATSHSDSQRPLRYIDGEGLSPIVYKNEEGRVLGVVPESVYLVFDALGLELDADLVPDARTLFELVNGRAEVSTAILYANLRIDDFPEPITICPTAMLSFSIHTVWLRERYFSEEQIRTLKDIKLGMINQPPGLEDAAGFPYDNVTSFNSVEALMKGLMSHRVDAVFMSWYHARIIAEKLGRADSIKRGPFVGNIQIHLAMLTEAFSPNVISSACAQVERLSSLGDFQRVFNNYLN